MFGDGVEAVGREDVVRERLKKIGDGEVGVGMRVKGAGFGDSGWGDIDAGGGGAELGEKGDIVACAAAWEQKILAVDGEAPEELGEGWGGAPVVPWCGAGVPASGPKRGVIG